MNKIDKQELKQLTNVFETIIEATEHFQMLIRDNQLDKSIFVLSSIVDGVTMLDQTIKHIGDEELTNDKEKVDQAVLLIAQELEKNKPTKILEILQFNLLPTLNKINHYLSDANPNEAIKITIGVYLDHVNPREVYPEARIDALVEEAKKQDCEIYFFSSEDVDFEKEKIMAEFKIDHEWVKQERNFPTVINNISSMQRNRQSLTERKLRRKHLVTSFALGNKMYLPKILLENRKYADLLVPFKIITGREIIFDYLKENRIGVLKPILGRQGQNIYFIEQINDRFKVSDHTTIHMLSYEELIKWLESGSILKDNSYMIQRYVEARTKLGEPFDIRAHMQKDYEGKWVITKIYPRMGNKKSILSNISRGGRTQPLEEFLETEFPDKKQGYQEELMSLAMGLTKHLDKLYNFALSEIGLDIAIDKDGRFWLHEANNGPESTYHEKERAVHTIGYAKYIAENGIVLTNQYDQLKFSKNQFNSKTSKLDLFEDREKVNIGMLIPENEVNQLTVASAYVAKYEDANFFYFAPSDIDFNAMLIRGYFYENNEWVAKVVEYPDVIYDRLRARGINQYNMIYEEFEDIPISNEFHGNSISKLEVYDKLSTVDELKPYLIPYRQVTRVKDISHFIDQYTSIIVKPEVGSFAKGVHYVEKKGFDEYFVVEGANEQTMTEFEMLNYFRSLIKKGELIEIGRAHV